MSASCTKVFVDVKRDALEFAAVKKLTLAAVFLALAVPAFAQAPEPSEPPPEAPPPKTAKPPSTVFKRFFFGGGIGASFGTVDYLEIAPLVGFRATSRLDLGMQPFYRWSNDDQYSTNVEYTDYGTRLFARFRVISSFFLEADYQFTSYEYLNSFGGTTRASDNSFLAGAGYTIPFGSHAGMYFSALYNFTYDDNDPYRAYDSPVQFQVGVSVGF
jgi:hypothetical protein